MPRRQRVHLDDVPLHIVQRGHNREPCFFGDEDCFTYLHWLGEALTETGGQLHAYALMTNHVHLLVIPHRVATKEWSANCDWQSTKTSPSGTSVSMRRLSACLGSVAIARPRGRPRLSGNVANEYVKGQETWGCEAYIEPGQAWPL
jgi:hypothetical protein